MGLPGAGGETGFQSRLVFQSFPASHRTRAGRVVTSLKLEVIFEFTLLLNLEEIAPDGRTVTPCPALSGRTTKLGNARIAQPSQTAAARYLLAFPRPPGGHGPPARKLAAGAEPERRLAIPAF